MKTRIDPLLVLSILTVGCEAETTPLVTLSPPVEVPRPAPIDEGDGFEVAPGLGRTFIVNEIRIAERGDGFDFDGTCATGEAECLQNSFWPIGQLANDQIRQGLLGGETLLLLELAGLATPASTDDPEVTLKIYGARDFDDPFFPANNFKIPPGHQTCCEFTVHPESVSMDVPPQARARVPGEVRGRVFSGQATEGLPITITSPNPPVTVSLERARAEIEISEGPAALSGLLGLVLPVAALVRFDNPYCKTVSPRCPVTLTDSTFLDLITALLGPRPDVDLDGDGLECLLDLTGDSAIDTCCDGTPGGACRADACLGAIVPPTDPSFPGSCALDPRMADGYSVAIRFSALPAKIVAPR